MKALRALDRALGRAEELACVFLLLAILFLAVFQSLFRNLISRWVNLGDMTWADVLVRHFTFYLGLCGAAIATREGRHINIDVMGRFLSAKLRQIIAIVGDLFAVVACIWLSMGGYYQVISAYKKETEQVIGPLRSWELQLAVPVAFGVFALHLALRAIYASARLAKGEVDDAPASAHGVSLKTEDEGAKP
jgi:TRAP-type C4-dicarboxylate transport system permease small subunit